MEDVKSSQPPPPAFNPYIQPNMNPAAPGFMPTTAQSKTPYDGYICHRCKIKGHWIQDCPTNNDPKFDPVGNKGQPKNHLWENIFNVHSQRFLKKREKVIRGLLRDEEDITIEPSIKATPVGGVVTTFGGGSSVEQDGEKMPPPPPSLTCGICHKLMKDAATTPCCVRNACYKCYAKEMVNRQLSCPFCRKSPLYLDDLINNKQLRLMCKWYGRHLIVGTNLEIIELTPDSNDKVKRDIDKMKERIQAVMVTETATSSNSNSSIMAPSSDSKLEESDSDRVHEAGETQNSNEKLAAVETEGTDTSMQHIDPYVRQMINLIKQNPQIVNGNKELDQNKFMAVLRGVIPNKSRSNSP